MDRRVFALLEERMADVGIRLDDPPLEELGEPARLLPAKVRRGETRSDFWLAYLPGMTFTEASRLARGREDRPLLVLGERISERSASAFREAGLNYLDAAGNAYIEFGPVLIDVRGRQPQVALAQAKLGGAGRSANLFSPRRARVVFVVVTWPELVRAGIREIATAARVSQGLAHDALGLLEQNGYLSTGEDRELRDRDALLNHWVASYPSGLAPTLRLAEFAGDLASVRAARSDQPIFVSGESAVTHLVRPTSLTIYVDELDPMLAIVNRWRTDAPPNIAVRRKFWQEPAGSDLQPDSPLKVPWTLAYADLMMTGEPRQRAAARELREDSARL